MTKTQGIGNIVDMAIMFTAMLRLFKPGSKALIKLQVLDFLAGLTERTSKADFNRMHDEFVNWFMANVPLSKNKSSGKAGASKNWVSWGQAAKTLDVILKVCIYYCNLPNADVAQNLKPWLRAAIDTPIFLELKRCTLNWILRPSISAALNSGNINS